MSKKTYVAGTRVWSTEHSRFFEAGSEIDSTLDDETVAALIQARVFVPIKEWLAKCVEIQSKLGENTPASVLSFIKKHKASPAPVSKKPAPKPDPSLSSTKSSKDK